jgi:two-component system, OmpR family, alkaline phosphatase synthesis response regulator PhoP
VEGSRASVLLVDDDDQVREALIDDLAARGYEVAAAASGEEALQRLRSGPLPCALLLDLLMPGMDGAELLEKVRGEEGLAGLPVIVLTGLASSKLQRLLGAAAVLVKPFDTSELCREIDRVCSRGRR